MSGLWRYFVGICLRRLLLVPLRLCRGNAPAVGAGVLAVLDLRGLELRHGGGCFLLDLGGCRSGLALLIRHDLKLVARPVKLGVQTHVAHHLLFGGELHLGGGGGRLGFGGLGFRGLNGLRFGCRSTVGCCRNGRFRLLLVLVGELLVVGRPLRDTPLLAAFGGLPAADDPHGADGLGRALDAHECRHPVQHLPVMVAGHVEHLGVPARALTQIRALPADRDAGDLYVLGTPVEAARTLPRYTVKLHLGILLGYLHSTLLKSFAFGLPSRSGSF